MKDTLRLVSSIEGIHCLGCLNRIDSKLSSLGADRVDIDVSQKIVKIDFQGEESNADEFVSAINELGYQAKKIVVYNPDE